MALAIVGCTEPPRVHARLESAPGVRRGTPVTFRGVTVGRVTEIEFPAGAVRLTMTLDQKDLRLFRGDSVRVRSLGALRDPVMEIVPGLPSTDTLRSGGSLESASPDSLVRLPRAIVDAMLASLARQSGASSPTPSPPVRAVAPEGDSAPRDSAGRDPRRPTPADSARRPPAAAETSEARRARKDP